VCFEVIDRPKDLTSITSTYFHIPLPIKMFVVEWYAFKVESIGIIVVVKVVL